MRSTALFSKIFITLTGASLVALAGYLVHTPEAEACGCFAPPDPSVQIVQGGERIVFAMEDGNVKAHIQIQYSGDAEEFAWLVPLPAIPEVGVGTDELFTQIIRTTQPRYRLTRQFEGNCPFDPNRGGFGGGIPDSANDGGAESPAPAEPGSPLIVRDLVGPYDFAVLSAESKDAMLEWLNTEQFFVPAGTDDAVDPYIRPGAYFLALKLRKDQAVGVGDLQPVTLTYQSELPMIPIVLTSVAADPDMPVLVWVMGESRAIPRNFFHTRINDAQLDWVNAASNYVDVVTRAVDEANGHHSFVTEYAGTSSVMREVLDYPGRFGNMAQLALITDAVDYVRFLRDNGFPTVGNNGFGFSFSSQVIGILQRHLPMPTALVESGIVTPGEYYISFDYYVGDFRLRNPELFVGLDLTFDPAELTAELQERVVAPTLEAGQMFRDHPYMSRLFTTMSPDEMTKDPVFSFNPDLPEVSNDHNATLTYYCGVINHGKSQAETAAQLVTEQGWRLFFPNGTGENDWLDVPMPASLETQILREEGDPEVVGNNDDAIEASINDFRKPRGSGGCQVASGTGNGGALALAFLALFAAVVRRRRI